MSGDRTERASEDEEPLAWMRPFREARGAWSEPRGGKPQYAPLARNPILRQVQEEEELDRQIWLLACSEAYGNGNLGLLKRMQGSSQQEIIADYFRRHPAVERQVNKCRDAGTCGEFTEAIQAEIARRKAGPEAGQPKPSQAEVNAWICDYYERAYREEREPPKRAEDAFPACHSAIGAVDAQMRQAMKLVPEEHKRKRGGRDRIGAIKSGGQIG